MQSISEVIKSRRTIHDFEPDRIPPEEDIKNAIEHAIWAPNHRMTEPWGFYLVGDETKEKICQLNAENVGRTRGEKAAELILQRWRATPGWLLISCDYSSNKIRSEEDYAASCCAAQNLMLYLWDIGVGVKWVTGSVVRDDRLYEIVNMDPAKEVVVGLFWYGYPSEVPTGLRKPAENKITELS